MLVYCQSKTCWLVATGCLDEVGLKRVVRWKGGKFLGGTGDGGVGTWFGGGGMRVWRGEDGDEDEVLSPAWRDENFDSEEKRREREGKDKLQAKCHCGGIRFYITRPNEQSAEARSSFPDLIVPYHSGTSSANPLNKPWFLRYGGIKDLAGLCACTSCRLASGMEIQPWAFIPKCNLVSENGEELDLDKEEMQGMEMFRRYASSKGKWRGFCGRCGATVFWWSEGEGEREERRDVVDVSVRILDPEQGARCEGWLEWWSVRVSFKEMAEGRGLVRSLEEGLRVWG